MHDIDYTKSPTEILLQMINRQNNVVLSINDFEFSLPEVFSSPYKPELNTTVTLTPLAGSGYYGSRSIHYRRNNLATIFGSMPPDFYPTEEQTLYELLPVLNATYGVNLKEADVEDAPIPPINPADLNAVRSVPVVAKANSYFYLGSFTFDFSPLTTPVIEDGVERLYYVHVTGLPFTEIKNSFVALKSDGVKSDSFNFLANTTVLTQVLVNEIHQQTNKTFVLLGNFTLTYTNADQVAVPVTNAKTLVIDKNGLIVSHAMTEPFDTALKYYTNPVVPFKYAIHDTGFASSNNLYRYNEDGTNDNAFVAQINYVPSFIRVDKNNKIYTVSPPILEVDPYDNNAFATQIVIDRLLSTGAIDPNFARVRIKSSDGLIAPLPLLDLIPTEAGGFAAVFNPLYTTDRNAAYPVVNGHHFVRPNPELITFSWNPVFRVSAVGEFDTNYNTSLFSTRDKAVYDTSGSPLSNDNDLLIEHDNQVTFMTYRQNPVTGYTHQQPITFDVMGDIVLLPGRAYADQYKWTGMRGLIRQSNGVFLGYGMLQSHTPGAAYSAAYSALARYKVDGDVDRVVWRAPVIEGSTPQITKVLMTEEVV